SHAQTISFSLGACRTYLDPPECSVVVGTPSLPWSGRTDASSGDMRTTPAGWIVAGSPSPAAGRRASVKKGLSSAQLSSLVSTFFTSLKSIAGRRTVPIPGVLREYLIAHRLRQGRSEGLLFGAGRGRPFTPSAV